MRGVADEGRNHDGAGEGRHDSTDHSGRPNVSRSVLLRRSEARSESRPKLHSSEYEGSRHVSTLERRQDRHRLTYARHGNTLDGEEQKSSREILEDEAQQSHSLKQPQERNREQENWRLRNQEDGEKKQETQAERRENAIRRTRSHDFQLTGSFRGSVVCGSGAGDHAREIQTSRRAKNDARRSQSSGLERESENSHEREYENEIVNEMRSELARTERLRKDLIKAEFMRQDLLRMEMLRTELTSRSRSRNPECVLIPTRFQMTGFGFQVFKNS